MYKFVKDKDFLHSMRSVCSDIVNQLVQIINNQDFLTVKTHLIGSGAKNLITQNENEPIDLDYNLVIINIILHEILMIANKLRNTLRKSSMMY